MCKVVTRNPKVVNTITKVLNNTQNDYLVAESEWTNGSRSDLVLSPKCEFSDLPPIIVEFQHRVDKDFMKRAITYCIQASDRYGIDPILVVVGINSLSLEILKVVKQSRVEGCYSFPCEVWAFKCIIFCNSSIDDCSLSVPLDPFIALGIFLTKGTPSVVDIPLNDDETINFLYRLAIEHAQGLVGTPHLIDVLKEVIEEKDREFDKILNLIESSAPREVLPRALNRTKSRNEILKEKYRDINITPTISEAKLKYIQGMEFVEDFKQKRIEEGKHRMDWV
jgi:hypothetical protein